MNRKKNLMYLFVFFVAVFSLCTMNARAVDIPDTDTGIDPQYIMITLLDAKLDINNSGRATCSTKVTTAAPSGYSVTLTCELSKDGTVIKSWTTTGARSASLNKSWYVTSGSDYQVIASATVYDSAGNYVDSGTAYSSVVPY